MPTPSTRPLLEHDYLTHNTDAVIALLGDGAYNLVKRALPPHTEDAEVEKVLATYRHRHGTHSNHTTHPYAGVLPMLTALDEAGLKLAVISNKHDAIVKRLAKEHFGSLIHVAIGERAGVPIKPEPDMLMMAMRALDVEADRALYIGDAATDFHAAQSAGTSCILARWGYGDPQALSLLDPLFFANDPAELPMLILQGDEQP